MSSVLLKYDNLANKLLTSGHTQTPTRPVPSATWWKQESDHKLPVGPSAGATFMRVLGMFPVSESDSSGGEDGTGSGTAEGDDAGTNRKSASTRDPLPSLSKQHWRDL